MKFTLRHQYHVGPDTFWREVFFDPAFNERLYREALQFESVKILEENVEADGRRTRRMAVTPRLDLPAPIKKVLGDSVSYVEEGRYDLARPSWIVRVIPSKLADKANVTSEMWLERTGPGQSDRVAEFNIDVNMFMIGGLFEKTLEKTMRDSYQKATDFTNAWLHEKGLAGKD